MDTIYRAVCSCGYRGRGFRDGNAATEAAENHAMKYDPYQGGRTDGKKHHIDVREDRSER